MQALQRKSIKPEYRQDPITRHWVVIAASRADRPIEFESPEIRRPNLQCPFCPGHEGSTPSASYECIDPQTGKWQVRFVANLYPAFDSTLGESGSIQKDGEPAYGVHEVIIESPRHVSRLTELTGKEVGVVFETYQRRLRSLASDNRIAYCLLFKNCGTAAGISLEHIHSQLVALPSIPPVVERELHEAREWFAKNDRCAFCDVINQSDGRVVETDERFIAVCPYASRFPYEMWILPKEHAPHFYQDDAISDLGRFVRRMLMRLERQVPNAAYNVILHSSPFGNQRYEHYHWHIEIIPRLATVAGLEWGSGIHVNTVAPEFAAQQLGNQPIGPSGIS